MTLDDAGAFDVAALRLVIRLVTGVTQVSKLSRGPHGPASRCLSGNLINKRHKYSILIIHRDCRV